MKTEDSTIYIQVVFHRRLKRIFTFFLRLITSSLPTVHSVYTPLLLFLVSERGPQGLERVGRVLRYSGAAAADRWPKQRENYSRRIINVSVRVIFQCCRSGPRGGSSWKLSFGVLVKTLLVPRVKEGPLSVLCFYYMYNIWQDAGIRTRVAATAVRCATIELNTFFFCD